jgi:uncharacterized protein (DUF952 family)
VIYHLVPEPELRERLGETTYTPADLERDSFVHCSGDASVLPVANDYFSEVRDRLLLLEIDPDRLSAEVRHEAAAPPPGGDASHLESAPTFPHVYGPIDRAAIARVGALERTEDGYAWPAELVPLERFLE